MQVAPDEEERENWRERKEERGEAPTLLLRLAEDAVEVLDMVLSRLRGFGWVGGAEGQGREGWSEGIMHGARVQHGGSQIHTCKLPSRLRGHSVCATYTTSCWYVLGVYTPEPAQTVGHVSSSCGASGRD